MFDGQAEGAMRFHTSLSSMRRWCGSIATTPVSTAPGGDALQPVRSGSSELVILVGLGRRRMFMRPV